MKKVLKALFALLLCAALSLPFAATGFAVRGDAGFTLDGQTLYETTKLEDGVTLTHVTTGASSVYGLQNFNVVEFDPSDRSVRIDAVGAGQFANDLRKVSEMIADFAADNPGLTPVAAVNGDLWMMGSAHSRVEGANTTYGGYSDPVVKKELTLPRGFNVYDGEIICSAYMYSETPYEGEFWAFGVDGNGRVAIGCPTLDVTLKSEQSEIAVDGFNRLPANNSLVLYSDKGCLSNYALDDAYELLIECGTDYTVTDGAVITGKVTGIYDTYVKGNPTISETTMILTARGDAIPRISGIKNGDKISFSFEVGERYGRDVDVWRNVRCAVGGHMPFVVDGVKNETGVTKGYPSTIVGVKNDGNVVIIANDGRQSDFSLGLDFDDYAYLADELDINTGIILDGGGSTDMTVLLDGEYKVVNRPSDGRERNVINSLIVSVGDDTEKAAASVKLPDVTDDLTRVFFTDPGNYSLLRTNIQATIRPSSEGAVITAEKYNGDCYFNMCFGLPSTTVDTGRSAAGNGYPSVSLDDYPYIILDIKAATSDPSAYQFQSVYVCAGEKWGASGDNFICFNNVINDGQFHRYVIDTTQRSNVSGVLNVIRIGFLLPVNGVTINDGDGIVLRSVRLASSVKEAVQLASFPFGDVETGKWYTDAVGYCYINGYLAGQSDVSFAPSADVTRAMMATIIAKLAGADLEYYNLPIYEVPPEIADTMNGPRFTDVAGGKWYTAPVNWASDNGIVSGIGGGLYGINQSVTREQIALMFMRLAQFQKLDVSDRADISGYTDAATAHGWAYEALEWAVARGLLSGTSGTGRTLSPLATSTRSQIAQIIMKYTAK